MHVIDYEINLNDEGRPCIDLPEDYEHKPEDKFFAIEMARYFLQVTQSKMTSPRYDQNTIDMMDVTVRLLTQVGDEMAAIMWDNMTTMAEMDMMINKKYHIIVSDLEDFEKFGKYIVYENKIFVKEKGLKAFILVNGHIYEFNGETWEKYEGSQ